MADNLLVNTQIGFSGYLDESVVGVHERFTFHLIDISCIIYKSDKIHMPPESERNSQTREVCENKAKGGGVHLKASTGFWNSMVANVIALPACNASNLANSGILASIKSATFNKSARRCCYD